MNLQTRCEIHTLTHAHTHTHTHTHAIAHCSAIKKRMKFCLLQNMDEPGRYMLRESIHLGADK